MSWFPGGYAAEDRVAVPAQRLIRPGPTDYQVDYEWLARPSVQTQHRGRAGEIWTRDPL